MRKIESIKINNHSELKKELVLNWLGLEKYERRPNNPFEIVIYDLLDKQTDFVELEKAKEYLKQFDLVAFQIVIYLPYAKTGFHSDGQVNRYLIPIQSHSESINFELDEFYNGKGSEQPNINYFQTRIGLGNGLSTQPVMYDEWFYKPNKNNITYNVKENECIEIGNNLHAHINYSPIHRIIIVFDTKNKIIE